MSNEKYYGMIHVLERYREKYNVGPNFLYRLALLYDHYGGRLFFPKESSGQDKKKGKIYLKKAENIYKHLIKADPKNLFAFMRLGELASAHNDNDKALRYYKYARKLRNKLPIKQKGSIPIGSVYERISNYRAAELWYKKDIEDMKSKDFGSYANLFLFYCNRENYLKARHMSSKLKRLIKKEFSKEVYKGTNILESKYIKDILDRVDKVEKY